MRWMKCMVNAKSRTSLDRAMRISMKTALSIRQRIHDTGVRAWEAYHVRLFRTQTSPRVQPTVVSPRRLCQLNNRSVLISLPKTRAVKMIRTAAQA